MTVKVCYPAKRAEQNITEAEVDLIRALYNSDRKVTAIKFIRQQYSLGLYEAKMICDTVANEHNWCVQV